MEIAAHRIEHVLVAPLHADPELPLQEPLLHEVLRARHWKAPESTHFAEHLGGRCGDDLDELVGVEKGVVQLPPQVGLDQVLVVPPPPRAQQIDPFVPVEGCQLGKRLRGHLRDITALLWVLGVQLHEHIGELFACARALAKSVDGNLDQQFELASATWQDLDEVGALGDEAHARKAVEPVEIHGDPVGGRKEPQGWVVVDNVPALVNGFLLGWDQPPRNAGQNAQGLHLCVADALLRKPAGPVRAPPVKVLEEGPQVFHGFLEKEAAGLWAYPLGGVVAKGVLPEMAKLEELLEDLRVLDVLRLLAVAREIRTEEVDDPDQSGSEPLEPAASGSRGGKM